MSPGRKRQASRSPGWGRSLKRSAMTPEEGEVDDGSSLQPTIQLPPSLPPKPALTKVPFPFKKKLEPKIKPFNVLAPSTSNDSPQPPRKEREEEVRRSRSSRGDGRSWAHAGDHWEAPPWPRNNRDVSPANSGGHHRSYSRDRHRSRSRSRDRGYSRDYRDDDRPRYYRPRRPDSYRPPATPPGLPPSPPPPPPPASASPPPPPEPMEPRPPAETPPPAPPPDPRLHSAVKKPGLPPSLPSKPTFDALPPPTLPPPGAPIPPPTGPPPVPPPAPLPSHNPSFRIEKPPFVKSKEPPKVRVIRRREFSKRTPKQDMMAYGRTFVGCGELSDYEVTKKLGEGTFGEVHKAIRKTTGEAVALKRILMHHEKEGMPVTALREIKILKALKHPCIINIQDMFVVRSNEKDPLSVYMVFPYMDHDLAGLLENERVTLTPSQIKLYMKHLLEGTEYMHRNHILHRDMKAANLLISNEGCLKIADFGLARSFDSGVTKGGSNKKYTNCVVTRWYRPPELLLGARQYGGEVDIWGIGCVLGEMFHRRPILPGTSDLDQLEKIWYLCGTPTQHSWPNFDALPGCEGVKRFKPFTRRLKKTYESVGPETVDLLDKLLVCNPKERITAAQALEHDYFWTEPLPADPKSLTKYEASHEFDKRGQRNYHPMPGGNPPPNNNRDMHQHNGPPRNNFPPPGHNQHPHQQFQGQGQGPYPPQNGRPNVNGPGNRRGGPPPHGMNNFNQGPPGAWGPPPAHHGGPPAGPAAFRGGPPPNAPSGPGCAGGMAPPPFRGPSSSIPPPGQHRGSHNQYPQFPPHPPPHSNGPMRGVGPGPGPGPGHGYGGHGHGHGHGPGPGAASLPQAPGLPPRPQGPPGGVNNFRPRTTNIPPPGRQSGGPMNNWQPRPPGGGQVGRGGDRAPPADGGLNYG